MSTIKADAVTAVSTNGDLSLDGLGTGGVSIASTLKMTKGGDIASASPLVIDTDGNYFDVTGTTNFSAMTVESGNFFMLQFDGVLTITHGSGIELPGAANLTTATGDRLICYATAADTVEVMSVETESAASGGAWNLIGTEEAGGGSGTATLDVTGLTSTYDTYAIAISNALPITDNAVPYLRFGDSSGVDSGSTDYGHHHGVQAFEDTTWGALGTVDNSDGQMILANATGGDVGEGCGFMLFLHAPSDGPQEPIVTGQGIHFNNGGVPTSDEFGGCRLAVITLDRVQFLFDSGNVESGRMTVWGIAHG
jgi:hypothetical protein